MPQELTTSREAEVLEQCQQVVGYQFRQPDLLRAALTHTSGADTRLASNERLEFLGDAVLGLVTCEQLFQRFPDYQEGDLTKIKSVVVSRRTCARISRLLNLGDFLFLGKGMHLSAVVPASLLADVYESLVAAIYLDGGLEAEQERGRAKGRHERAGPNQRRGSPFRLRLRRAAQGTHVPRSVSHDAALPHHLLHPELRPTRRLQDRGPLERRRHRGIEDV